MKKLLAAVFAIALVLSLSACGDAPEEAPAAAEEVAENVAETVRVVSLPAAETEIKIREDAPAPAESPVIVEPKASEAPAEPESSTPAAPVETTVPTPVEAPTQKPAETPIQTAARKPADPPAEGPAETTAPVPEAPAADPKTVAMGFIGRSANSLYAAIGYPVSSDYAPSCLGDGEDGNLYYNGFTVYTYRENGAETIQYVE